MCRAGWGQAVRADPHLAHPRGYARWCFGLESDSPLNIEFDFAGVWRVIAYFLLPVPRGHPLSEQLRDTPAKAAGQRPAHRCDDRSVGIGRRWWLIASDELPTGLEKALGSNSGDCSNHSDVELPEQFLGRSHRAHLPCSTDSSPECHCVI